MRMIQAYIGKEFVWFKEIEELNQKAFKAGKLKHHDYFKWLEDKNKIYDELKVLIIKGNFKQEVKI